MDDDDPVLQQRQHQARLMTYAQSDSQDVRRKHSAAINTHKIDPNRKAYYAEQQKAMQARKALPQPQHQPLASTESKQQTEKKNDETGGASFLIIEKINMY